jgi:hypothetical protein
VESVAVCAEVIPLSNCVVMIVVSKNFFMRNGFMSLIF